MNVIFVAIMIIVEFIASIYDYKTKREVLPLTAIAFLFIALIMSNPIALLATVLVIPISRLLAIFVFRGFGKGSVYHILLDVIPTILVLVMAFAASLISKNVEFLGMSKWSSQVMFSTLFLLLFSIALEPSIELPGTLGFVARAEIDHVINIAKGLAHIAGFISIVMLSQFYGAYAGILMLMWILMLLVRGRLAGYMKTFVEITPYAITFLIALIKGL
ncbi:MAG: hypothetical protein QW348_06545 [Ignisphaera sp.]